MKFLTCFPSQSKFCFTSAAADSSASGGASGATTGSAATAAAPGAGSGGIGAAASAGGSAATVDWSTGLSEDLRGYAANKGWKGPADIVESYRGMEKLLGNK